MPETVSFNPHVLWRQQFKILTIGNDPTFVEFLRAELQGAGIAAGFRAFPNVDETLAYLHRGPKSSDLQTADLGIIQLSAVTNADFEFLTRLESLSGALRIPILFADASTDSHWIDLLDIIRTLKKVADGRLQRTC